LFANTGRSKNLVAVIIQKRTSSSIGIDPRVVVLLVFVAFGSIVEFGIVLQAITVITAFSNIFKPQGRIAVVLIAPLISGAGNAGISFTELAIPLLLALCAFQASASKPHKKHRFPSVLISWGVLAVYIFIVSLPISLSFGTGILLFLSDSINYVLPFFGLFVLSKDTSRVAAEVKVFLAFYFFTVATFLFVSLWAANRGFTTLTAELTSSRGIDAAFSVLVALTYPFKKFYLRVLAIVVSGSGLLLTGSRTSWGVALAGFSVAFLFIRREQSAKTTLGVLAATVSGLLILRALVTGELLARFGERIQLFVRVLTQGTQGDASAVQRSQATAQVLSDWQSSILFGSGPGHAYSWIIWDPKYRQLVTSSYQIDSPLAPLGELGLVGFCLLIVSLAVSLHSLVQVARLTDLRALAVSTSIAIMTLGIFFYAPTDAKAFTALLVALFLLCDSAKIEAKQNTSIEPDIRFSPRENGRNYYDLN